MLANYKKKSNSRYSAVGRLRGQAELKGVRDGNCHISKGLICNHLVKNKQK